jgi:DNA-directed RNA polymerase sigma subunit (sigma70/sigma32)
MNVVMAGQTDLPEAENENLRRRALGQMSAINRNAHGLKRLAIQYGFSREEVRRILEEFADEMKTHGNSKPLEPCYDYSTGRYLSFEEWMAHYLKIWDKLSV